MMALLCFWLGGAAALAGYAAIGVKPDKDFVFDREALLYCVLWPIILALDLVARVRGPRP